MNFVITVTYLLDLCFHIPLVLEEHSLGYDKGFGGASKVVFGGMIDRIDHIQMAFDLKKIIIDFCPFLSDYEIMNLKMKNLKLL